MNREIFARRLARVRLLAAALAVTGCSAEIRGSRLPSPAPVGCQDISASAFQVETEHVASMTPFARQHFSERLDSFSEAPLNCQEIVMLGDSLTELNDWNASVPLELTLRNRGISGDTTDGVLLRLDEVIAIRPRAVFLMIGTNDLWSSNSPDLIASNILKIVEKIHVQSPSSTIFVQTILPVAGAAADWGGHANKKVRAVNALLKAASGDPGFILLDTYAMAADQSGSLKAGYTTDGVHLNEAGYKAWSVLVTEALRRYHLSGRSP